MENKEEFRNSASDWGQVDHEIREMIGREMESSSAAFLTNKILSI
jgi:hypothetical protein